MASSMTARMFSRRALLRLLIFLAIAFLFSCTLFLWSHPMIIRSGGGSVISHHDAGGGKKPATHPIDTLIKKAEREYHRLMAEETTDLESTAKAYRYRRGRHPPPWFDKWFKFAQDHDAVIVEDFFDQIYHDLGPFWGVDAAKIRTQAKNFEQVVIVRNGTTSQKTDKPRDWMNIWTDLTSTISEWLPDIDVPINVMDESRLLVPWEDIDQYMKAERASRKIVPKPEVITEYAGLQKLDENPGEPFDLDWHGGNYWENARVGCAPGSPSRNVEAATNFSGPPPMPHGFPERSYEGYVMNWTSAKDPCLQPDIRESHGTFVEPISQSTSKFLFPIFGGSKLPMNNEILLPPAMYWSDDPFYSGGEEDHGGPWEEKNPGVMWRGAASGGRNKEDTWTRFQRHRFLTMINGTSVQLAEKHGNGVGKNFVLSSYSTYHLTATQHMDLGSWLNSIVDAAFVNLLCFPPSGDEHCWYTNPFYQTKPGKKMQEQYAYKYLPDIDGNSFSGRYRGFMRSTSLPIKATIYSEWHDSRLVPWVHFVPMDNSFVDIYGILDYFIGTGVEEKDKEGNVFIEGAHDEQAKEIALKGQEWAERVLRKEDMQVYVMRLYLEYARICDDNRDRLGFIGDVG
ncbi:uncharacterized protein BDZ99DRAFT_465089 [Mytilinidion resinicola]|uniref:Glycosyl transferase CAP10 domain-containing protein n=1 Tax=Mytilinidion resinicola TaxID=574789 RepID=A0A6A6YEX5_9PEZI|nr:uncharacterized protein BDZ99DRAFT_465089 [Mytilinidion resinicola]KAF2807159.1 hypothetical protein BDZ99DRAFT_465089 [Mytilinidion resinicola]